ncbi:hypothetical protein BA893_19115 [Vibrio natriegens]|jgi:Fe2+ transport system protein B|uniref:hypothetical protein n=1 Tax=Vibrio natriegens TaxID=691 RepID=UPI0008043C40|nr:hypothetical protein [Vibrio natriegens]ANQ23749.1 hypothetical protein BA893_19115 [Vibrio natriegens]
MSEGFPYPKLTKQLTVLELEDIREELLALSEAMRLVPSEFDASFQQKINRVLDIISEVEHHSKQLRAAIEQSQKAFSETLIQKQQKQYERLLKAIDKRIEDKLSGYIPVTKGLILTALFINALLVGSILGAVFYLLAFAM